MKKSFIAVATILALGLGSCVTDGASESAQTDAVNEVKETVENKVEEVKEKVEEVIEETTTAYTAGEEVYKKTCMACHQANGEGIAGAFPPLAKSDYLLEDKNRAIKQVLEGSSGEMVVNGVTYNGTMTAQAISDQEVVDVLNYVLNSWGNEGGEVTLDEVAAQK